MVSGLSGYEKNSIDSVLRRGIFCLLILLCVGYLTGCGQRRPKATPEPNEEVTYEKGADLTGVVKDIDEASGLITFYNPIFESEESFLYDSGTEILSKYDSQMSMEEVERGEVYDLYVNDVGSGLDKMKATSDIVEEEDVEVSVDADTKLMTIDDVSYSYSDFVVSLSGDKQISPMEITTMDRVTLRGVKGKVYSVVVTKGHGYIQPEGYQDFVGGTITIDGEAILPVSDGMLITVPEGVQTITMQNGFLSSKVDAEVGRDEVTVVDMAEYMTTKPNTAAVTFHIYPEGAELYINGTMVDYSSPVPLYYGVHTVQVVLEGYNNYLGTITIQDPEPVIRIDLAEETASVEESDTSTTDDSLSTSVTDDDGTIQNPSSVDYDVDHKVTVSAPDGVSVYINGTYKGVAPCSFTKMIGSVTLTLQREGYQTKSYSLDIVDDDEDVTLSFPDLEVN